MERLTQDQIEQLYEREPVTKTTADLSAHLLLLASKRYNTESVRKENIEKSYQHLATGWGKYGETARLLDYTILAVWRDLVNYGNEPVIQASQNMLRELKEYIYETLH